MSCLSQPRLKGRTCIAEMLEITPEISRMLRKGTEGEEIVDYAVRTQGMMTLAEAAARKLCRGMISYDHVQHLLMSTHQRSTRRQKLTPGKPTATTDQHATQTHRPQKPMANQRLSLETLLTSNSVYRHKPTLNLLSTPPPPDSQ